MAEFCLACWNKLMGTDDPPEKFIISKEVDFCEGCGEWKPVVIGVREKHRRLKRFWGRIAYLCQKMMTSKSD